MMTPSRKPSRATVITASIAIGVFGAGAGLGTVIASRSQPTEREVMRLAAGTYHLDDGEQAWRSQGGGGGNDPVPLSGSDEGSTITNKGSKDTKLCLTATADGHAVAGGAGGCVALPVLASAIAPMQRPGNPKSTATTTPKKESSPAKSSAPEPNRTKAGQPAPDPRRTAAGQAPDPGRTAPAQPPATYRPSPAPAPVPTKKVSGSISESGSLIERPAEKPKLNIGPSSGPKVSDERGAKQTNDSKPAQPSGTLKPALPSGTGEPTVPQGTGKPTPPVGTPKPSGTHKPALPPSAPTAAPKPSGTLKPALPAKPGDPARPSQQGQGDPRPAAPSAGAQPPTAAPDHDGGQAPDGTVLRPAQPTPEGGIPEGAESLPIFKDPELLRRAQEALGLDKNMRYTDENGVWDLNIAPPGTPPCRDYSAAELRALSTPQGAVIPRDSCLWPAFIRWLYAEPEAGQTSNWTKFTGLPERNLELVVTNPSPAQPGQSDQPGQVDPAQPVQPFQSGHPTQSGRFDPARPDSPDRSSRFDGSGRVDPAQPSRSDRHGPGQPVHPGPGQVEPESDGYTGP